MSEAEPGRDGIGSRRALLNGAGALIAGGAALALSACGSTAAHDTIRAQPRAVRRQDIEILAAALALERRTVAAYVAGIALLPHPQAKAAEQFLSEELQHTGELISLLTAAGAKPGPRANSFALGRPHDAVGVLALLHELEALQIATYLRAIPRLSPGPVRSAVASILTVDAQHLTMVRVQQGQTPVPAAFVSGGE